MAAKKKPAVTVFNNETQDFEERESVVARLTYDGEGVPTAFLVSPKGKDGNEALLRWLRASFLRVNGGQAQ